MIYVPENRRLSREIDALAIAVGGKKSFLTQEHLLNFDVTFDENSTTTTITMKQEHEENNNQNVEILNVTKKNI